MKEESGLSSAALWDAAAVQWAARIRGGEANREVILDEAHLALLGHVRGLTVLDLGCGEGRFARMLSERGARVTGVDVAPTMVRLAQEMEDASPLGVRYLTRDAARLDGLADGAFELVVAYMSFMDIEDHCGAIREAGRVLRPNGRFVFSILHPCFDELPPLGWERREPGVRTNSNKLHFKVDNYFGRRPRLVRWGEWWPGVDFATVNLRRPISDYASALRDAGFLIRNLLEPTPPPEVIEQDPESWGDNLRIAYFLIFDCLKP